MNSTIDQTRQDVGCCGLSEAEERRRGEALVRALYLRKHGMSGPSPNYRTEWGTKTALGLFRMVERIVKDGDL